MNRYKRQEIANDTLSYIQEHPEKIYSKYYNTEKCKEMKQKELNKGDVQTKVEVRYQDVVWTVVKEDKKVTILNFASAKNPGGGWLGGSQAQEEAIARSSTMYAHIKDVNEFYKNPKHHGSPYYDNDVIYSSNVKMIKNPDGKLFNKPILFDMITCAAVNVSAIKQVDEKRVNREMKERIENIFEVAIENGTETLVLGAFGTGVFKNKPQDVANIFKEVIYSERYKNKIPHIIFSIVVQDYLVDIFKVVEKE